MDQVTRKRMHKGLCKAFDDLTANLQGTALMPAMAMRPIDVIHINGEPYEVRMVLARPDDEEDEET